MCERWQGYKPQEVEPIEKDLKSGSRDVSTHGGRAVTIGMLVLKYILF